MNQLNVFTFVALTITITLLSGCSPQDKGTKGAAEKQVVVASYDRALPKYPSRYWQDEMKPLWSSLQSDERDLLNKFMSRYIKTSPTTDQLPIPEGFTVSQAIATQRIIETITAQHDTETATLKELIHKQEGEILTTREAALHREKYEKNSLPSSRQEVMIRYGIPELERQLQVSMQKDRADPRWQEFQTDSTTTAKVRMRLLAAQQAAEQLLQSSSRR